MWIVNLLDVNYLPEQDVIVWLIQNYSYLHSL